MIKNQPSRIMRISLALGVSAALTILAPSAQTGLAADSGSTSVTGNNRATLTIEPPAATGLNGPVHVQASITLTGPKRFGLGLDAATVGAADASLSATQPSAAPAAGASTVGAPPSVDLSQYDPPVGNQGQVNSCGSWATGYTLLGWYANKYGVGGAPYAPMYVYSQLTGGRNIGTTLPGNLSLEQQQGIDTQSDYTQGNYDYWDQPTPAERQNASHYKITGFGQIYVQGGGNAQQAIQNALANGQPVVIGLPVYGNFMYASASQPYVDVPPPGSTLYGGHAVLAVKYDANGLWVENQWGTGWGLNGYAELSWAFVNNYLLEADTITGFNGSGPGPSPSPNPSPSPSPSPSPTPTGGATVTLTPSSGYPGTMIVISGSGFHGGELVQVSWNGNPIAVLVASPSGTVSLAANLSPTAAPGPRAVTLTGSTGDSASATFTVL